jgi:hypothetical protein
MAKEVRLNVGDLVELTFLDHAENSDDAMEFVVYGKLFAITRTAYKVGSWVYADDVSRAKDSNTDNENYFTIVKKAITKKRKLRS